MKKVFAVTFAVIIALMAALPVFAAEDKNPSPSKPTEYNVVVHNQNGGTASYTTKVDKDGKHVTLVAHPKNGYKFKGWKLKGKYIIESGDLSDEEIRIILQSDVEATPYYEKIDGSSSRSGSTVSINSGTVSPKTGEEGSLFVIIAFAAAFAVIACALGVKLAVGKK